MVPSSTPATTQPLWVQFAENPRNSPLVGWVTTTASSSKTVPPPTGTSLAAAKPSAGGFDSEDSDSEGSGLVGSDVALASGSRGEDSVAGPDGVGSPSPTGGQQRHPRYRRSGERRTAADAGAHGSHPVVS